MLLNKWFSRKKGTPHQWMVSQIARAFSCWDFQAQGPPRPPPGFPFFKRPPLETTGNRKDAKFIQKIPLYYIFKAWGILRLLQVKFQHFQIWLFKCSYSTCTLYKCLNDVTLLKNATCFFLYHNKCTRQKICKS